MEDIMKRMGQRAFGGKAGTAKRTSSTPVAPVTPKRLAVQSPTTGPSQGPPASPATDQEEPAAPVKEPRIPPIFMDLVPDWPAHAKAMSAKVDGDFEAYARGEHYLIKTSTVAHFRLLQRYCRTNELPFHTYGLGRRRNLKVVISGLPRDMTDTILLNTLEEEGFLADSVARLRTARGPTNSWLVTFSTDTDHPSNKRPTDIYSQQTLMHVRVRVTGYKRPRGPPQCHRCQGFGHGSINCGRRLQCVRCGEAHAKEHCPKPFEEKGKCCNCGGDHNASYRGCKAYRQAKEVQARANRPKPAPPVARRQVETVHQKRKALEEVEPATESDSADSCMEVDDFQMVRRRRRKPRNPANRREAGSSQKEEDDAPYPTPRPRETMRKKIDWPPPVARKIPPPAAKEGPAQAPATKPPTPEDITRGLQTILATICQQLTAATAAINALMGSLPK